MHRSGTSVITRAVNLLGVYLGEATDLMPPAADNPRGYWERQDIANLNDEILCSLKMFWNTSLPLPEGWHLTDEMRPMRDKAASLLGRAFPGYPLWAWKDPRSTLLFDLWRDVILEQGAELVCLFVVRNPLDVARSLHKRDGFPLDKGFGVWFNYNLAALRSSHDLTTAFLSYDMFLSDREAELRRCAGELGIQWPEDDTALREKMAELINPDLRHSYSGREALVEAGAPAQVIELNELLEGFVSGAGMHDKKIARRIEKIVDEFSSYSRFFIADQVLLFQTKSTQRDLERMLADKEQQLAEKNHHIHALLNSWSWRITAPLRKLHAIFSKKVTKE